MTSIGKFVVFWVFLVFYVIFFFVSLLLIHCRSKEHDHVKDNLSAKLLRIQTFGKMKFKEFKDLISVADYKTCEAKMDKHPTWYPLTLDVFVKFLYKVILPSLMFLCFFSCFCHLLIFFCFRESYQMQQTLQQGCIGRLRSSRSGLLLKFGTL